MQHAHALILALAVAASAPACRRDLGSLAAVAPPTAAARVAAGPRVEGKDCALWLLGMPVGSPSLADATRAALVDHGGAHRLVDVRVQSSYWSAVAVGQECLIVTGTPAP